MNGQLCRIDLTQSKVTTEDIPSKVLETFIGGKGLGAYYLYNEMDPTLDPLDPRSTFVLATGPAQGILPIAGRYCIVAKSPHSGIFIDSHVGGFLGPELRFAGYNAILVTGRAKHPVVIRVIDSEVTIEDAEDLWGRMTLDTEDELKRRYGQKTRIISIGPAAENGVSFASTTSDYYRTAARGGIGLLLASKNLKAIAVRGTKKIDIPEVVKLVSRDINMRAKESKLKGHLLPVQGTSWLVEIASARDQLPTENYSSGEWENATAIGGGAIEEKYRERIHPKPCYKCSLACSFVIDTEWSERPVQHPEYESLGLLGSNLGISDLDTLLKLNHRCNELGMDTISTGSTISWYIESCRRGIIPEKYADEYLSFGDGEGVLELVERIAYKQGIGEILSGGVKRASELLGGEEWAVHVRGLELPAWDPRGKLGLGLSYITSNVGGSHLRGWPSTSDFPNRSALDVIDSLIEQQDLKILKDSLIMCHFTHSIRPALSIEDTARIFESLTGIPTTAEDMRMRAQAIWILCRQFNVKVWGDQSPRDGDYLPYRLMRDPLPSGAAKGCTSFVSDDDLEASLDLFYSKRKCDKDGRPLDEELSKLGL